MSRCSVCYNSDCTCGICVYCEEKQDEVDQLQNKLAKAIEIIKGYVEEGAHHGTCCRTESFPEPDCGVCPIEDKAIEFLKTLEEK